MTSVLLSDLFVMVRKWLEFMVKTMDGKTTENKCPLFSVEKGSINFFLRSFDLSFYYYFYYYTLKICIMGLVLLVKI